MLRRSVVPFGAMHVTSFASERCAARHGGRRARAMAVACPHPLHGVSAAAMDARHTRRHRGLRSPMPTVPAPDRHKTPTRNAGMIPCLLIADLPTGERNAARQLGLGP